MKHEHREILNQLEACRNMIREEVENKKTEVQEADMDIIETEENISKVSFLNTRM
jgi:hypothetical protein